MKTAEVIGLGAVALLAFGFIKKATALGTLNFYPDKVTKIEFEGPVPVMTLSLLTQNSSSQSFTIRSITGNVYANGTLVGNIGTFGVLDIHPNSEGLIYLKARLNLIGITNDIIRAMQYGNFSQKIKLEGYANVDNYQIPLDFDFQIGNPAKVAQMPAA